MRDDEGYSEERLGGMGQREGGGAPNRLAFHLGVESLPLRNG